MEQITTEEKTNTAVEPWEERREEIRKMNVYQKLAEITDAVGVVAKNLNVETGRGKTYKAVAERDVLDAVKRWESYYRIYSYPVSREILESNVLESESVYNGNVTKRTTFMTRIKTTYRFVNVDNPSEYVETTTFAEGIDAQDKGSGKAMTYCDKYALMKTYKISTGDDPDQMASEEIRYTQKPRYGEGYAPQVAPCVPQVAPTVTVSDAPLNPKQIFVREMKNKGVDMSAAQFTYGLTKETPMSRYEEILDGLGVTWRA